MSSFGFLLKNFTPLTLIYQLKKNKVLRKKICDKNLNNTVFFLIGLHLKAELF